MVFMLSSPYASAGAFSVTPENFEKALVLHAVKRIPKATWTNDKDAFYAPSVALPDEFVTDCVVWSAFAGSNNCVSLRNIQYKDKVYQIDLERYLGQRNPTVTSMIKNLIARGKEEEVFIFYCILPVKCPGNSILMHTIKIPVRRNQKTVCT